MTLGEFVNKMCRDLPEGWMLTVEMEHHAGWIELHDPDGNEIEFEDFTCVDFNLEAQGEDALRYAIEIEKAKATA